MDPILQGRLSVMPGLAPDAAGEVESGAPGGTPDPDRLLRIGL
jgi:hypothetical protein